LITELPSNSDIRYSEAFHILYQNNTFHFRGAPGVLALKSSLSAVQWQSIRHIHISTLFQSGPSRRAESKVWLPECSLRWDKCCQLLSEIPDLDSLRLDIFIEEKYSPDGTALEALRPLKRIQAKVFEVELNIDPSSYVRHFLGPINFAVFVRERPHNTELYGATRIVFMEL